MVAQNFKILLEEEKQAVRGPDLVTLADTKQGLKVQSRMENGPCNI